MTNQQIMGILKEGKEGYTVHSLSSVFLERSERSYATYIFGEDNICEEIRTGIEGIPEFGQRVLVFTITYSRRKDGVLCTKDFGRALFEDPPALEEDKPDHFFYQEAMELRAILESLKELGDNFALMYSKEEKSYIGLVLSSRGWYQRTSSVDPLKVIEDLKKWKELKPSGNY